MNVEEILRVAWKDYFTILWLYLGSAILLFPLFFVSGWTGLFFVSMFFVYSGIVSLYSIGYFWVNGFDVPVFVLFIPFWFFAGYWVVNGVLG